MTYFLGNDVDMIEGLEGGIRIKELIVVLFWEK